VDNLPAGDYQALSEFRYQIRKFLRFSEEAARSEGLEPHQHQMLLAIKALGDTDGPTVGRLATHLLIRHHSAVGLLDRLEERRLIKRIRSSDGDRRRVCIHLTRAGGAKLRHLARVHRAELRTSGPDLVRALQAVLGGKNEQV